MFASARPLDAAAIRRRMTVLLSFPLAFALHDGEEVLAARRWREQAPALLLDRVPWLPASVLLGHALGAVVAGFPARRKRKRAGRTTLPVRRAGVSAERVA